MASLAISNLKSKLSTEKSQRQTNVATFNTAISTRQTLTITVAATPSDTSVTTLASALRSTRTTLLSDMIVLSTYITQRKDLIKQLRTVYGI